MDRLTNPQESDDSQFAVYQNYMFEHGIHLEKIYTESGKMYYKSSLDPLKNLQKIWLSPYHFVSTKNHPAVLEKTLPLYFDGENHWLRLYLLWTIGAYSNNWHFYLGFLWIACFCNWK